MINSVSRIGAVAQQDAGSQQAANSPAKPKETQRPDSVVLIKHATQAAGDVDHDGDSR
jgi:hypothetical protein